MSPPSLQLAAARHTLFLATAEELIEMADALLTCGIYSHALGELGTVRNAIMYEVEPLFLRTLKEFNIPRPCPEEAVAIVVRHCIYSIAEEVGNPLETVQRFFRGSYYPLVYSRSENLIRESSGGRELLGLAYELDDIEGLAQMGDLTPEQREKELAALEHRTREFAQDWTWTHLPSSVDPSWLTANGGSVASLARAIREGRRFAELPVLADALEEAGCTDANLLAHCRDPGTHRERCCVLDLLLDGPIA